MKYAEKKPAVLLLEDGTVFYGKSAGAIGTTTGEICFNTGMTGYQEIFTDPSYYRQILLATHVHIGNYGIHDHEVESNGIKIAGLVCRSFNIPYSRKSASKSIQEYFTEEKIVGICDVDTRAIVRHIRNKGAMNCIVSSETSDVSKLKKMLSDVPSMKGLELSSVVTTSKPYFGGNPSAKLKVAIMDYGVKKNIIRSLVNRDCYVQVFPAKSTYADVKSWNPDGIMLSNGPGDPAVMPYAVNTVKEMLANNEVIFGICLGHQLLAEACGIGTFKMFNGHRGINHPVKNIITGRCEVTSQNHGFGVIEEDVKKSKKVEITHVNLNDNSIEGIRVKDAVAFSVQYHPESSPGPHDSAYLFDDFVTAMKKVEVEQ
ncbi:MAG: carbamoyl-phosphate synthase small subunit [Bacteroidetes bacterium]|nr:MAG: carbamoyl-phosphate synthase small subunit [Bacteroidota bacterium]REK05155.1 MAG: carbamoyl-phosphate synthase small subunit [Bacteroidota bacterium]REK32560.1 MAG: carbamoyl-phosphate synthase small subunit [Bacteroidota bacterium]REK48993.1 MAG: carbamoyl-phosphate synthase small subunit [Bacteroidota bacterium]